MTLEFFARPVAPDIVVFELKGRMHSGNRLSDAEYAARQVVSAGNKKLVVDISGVDHMDSAALGMLVLVTTEMAKQGGKAYIAGANPRVSEMFKICQAQVVLHLQDSVENALKALAAV